jgi:hypothetical protein
MRNIKKKLKPSCEEMYWNMWCGKFEKLRTGGSMRKWLSGLIDPGDCW